MCAWLDSGGKQKLMILFVKSICVPGKVSLTCDAWQASNTDGYFAVTVHRVQEPMLGKWELKSALIGFTQLNNAHNGEQLGQALFKIVKRLGIEHKVSALSLSVFTLSISHCNYAVKVGHVTCDNTSNNSTMLKELAARLKSITGKPYNWKNRKIKCIIGPHTCQFRHLTESYNIQLSCTCHQPGDTDAYLNIQQDASLQSKAARCACTNIP